MLSSQATRKSNHIRKGSLHLAKIPDAANQQQPHQPQRQQKPRPIKPCLTANNRPAEAINHPHHRIQRIQQPPFLRHNIAAKPV